MFYVAYILREPREPIDGETVATGRGWLDWGDWVMDRAADYPEAAHLAQEGFLEGEESLAALEHELEQVLHAAGADRGAIAANLLSALRARPEESLGILVTDGEPGDGEEADGDG